MLHKYYDLPSNGSELKQFLRLPVFTSAIFFLAACNSSHKDDHPQTTDSVITRASSVDSPNAASHPGSAGMLQITGEPLYVYYTDATTIYNLIPKNPGGKTKGKIVFQYVVNSNGALTLAAFAGNQHSQGFDPKKMVIMTNSKTAVTQIPTQLFLSDQEMSKHNYKSNDDLTPLLDEIKKHLTSTPGKYDGYIAFRPSLVPFDDPTYQTIEYEVEWYPTTDDIDKRQPFTPIPGAMLNPSPPKIY